MRNFFIRVVCLVALLCVLPSAFAQVTNLITNPVTNSFAPLIAPSLPDAGLSFVRVLGALALVIGLFLGGAWLFKNWRRLAVKRGCAPKLNIFETRSLGNRHAVFVVGYERERFLIASSPAGVNLLSHLPVATEEEKVVIEANSPTPSFAQALAKVLQRK
jgi:flagellar biogenesis protein FliO